MLVSLALSTAEVWSDERLDDATECDASVEGYVRSSQSMVDLGAPLVMQDLNIANAHLGTSKKDLAKRMSRGKFLHFSFKESLGL